MATVRYTHTHTHTHFFLKHVSDCGSDVKSKNRKKSKSNFLTIAILPSLLMSLESKKIIKNPVVIFLTIAILPSLIMSLESKNHKIVAINKEISKFSKTQS